MNPESTDLVSTKARMEAVAAKLCHAVHRDTEQVPTWEWINEKSLRIWNADGSPMMTLHLESVQ